MLIYARAMLIYARAMLIYARAMLIYARAMLIYARAMLIYVRAMLIYARTMLIYARTMLNYARAKLICEQWWEHCCPLMSMCIEWKCSYICNVLVFDIKIVLTPKRTVFIKRTGFKIFLLNVPYDLKNYPLCNYKTGTYNRKYKNIDGCC